ncbi:MAG: POTRA domain-containing protein [Candidatus Angelobacter sp.]
MVVLCLGLCAAQRQPISVPQNPAQAAQSPQGAATPPKALAGAPSPAPTATRPASGLQLSSGLNTLQGLKVAMMQINGPGVDDAESLLSILPQKVNEPLDKYKVRQSVQALYNTGRFAEIQVEAHRNPTGEVVLAFDARENYFFGSILAEGSSAHPSDSQLVNASKLNLGEQYTEDKITAGIEGMQRTLQENGYYQATIKPFYEWDSRNQ